MSYLLSAIISNEVIFIAIGLLLAINIFLTIRLQKTVKQNKEDNGNVTSLPITHSVNNSAESNEAVAAITATIAAILDAEAVSQGKPTPKFIVRQIKK